MNLNLKKEGKQRTSQLEALMGTIRLCGPAGDGIQLARLSVHGQSLHIISIHLYLSSLAATRRRACYIRGFLR
jgi:hypothetical protein